MISYLTTGSAVAEIRMLRLDPRHRGAVILVEGATDARLFANLIMRPEVTIRWMNGRTMVVNTVALLEKEGFAGLLAIVDADFWHLDGVPSNIGDNVVFTETHDIDLMLFDSQAAYKIAGEYYYEAAEFNGLSKEFPKLKQILLEAAREIGFIRWVNKRDNYGLSFKDESGEGKTLDLLIAFDPGKQSLDTEKLLDLICPRNTALRQELASKLYHTKLARYDPLLICNGHDVMQLTCIMIKHKDRRHVRRSIESVELEAAFRLAYERRFFEETQLFQRIQEWQERTGYAVV